MLDAQASILKHKKKGVLVDSALLVLLPHVLSQVSDLSDLRGEELRRIRRLFKSMVEQIEESYEVSRVLVAIATVCSKGILVLTTDLALQLELERRGADALNFNHVRQLAWAYN